MQREFYRKASAALRGLGYHRLSEREYKAPWTSDRIDHFVYLRWLKKWGEQVSVSIGIRHREAQDFAIDMLRKFGPALMLENLKVGPNECWVGFQLGKLCSWPLPFSLYVGEIGVDGCVTRIVDDLQDTLHPLVEGINNDAAMYDFLTQIEIRAMRPLNGAVHAAEIIFVGKRLGYSQDEVLSDMEPFLPAIPNQIDETMTVEDYLARVWSSA